MKALKILLLMVMIFALATVAMAVEVNIRIDDGPEAYFTLNSMQIGPGGDITLSVSSLGNPPTLTLSLSPNSLPSGTINTSYSQIVTMSALNGQTPYTFDCSGSGINGITAGISGTDQCVISGTPTATGTYTVNFSVTDSTTPTPLTDSKSRTINVSPVVSAKDIGARYPNKLEETIGPNASKSYFFKLDNNYDDVKMYMLGYWNGDTNMVLSRTFQPTCGNILPGTTISNGTNGVWYKLSGSTGEVITLSNIYAKTGDTFYVTICNTSKSDNKFTLYWNAGNW